MIHAVGSVYTTKDRATVEAFSFVSVYSSEGRVSFVDVTFGEAYRDAYGHLDGVSVAYDNGVYFVDYVDGTVDFLVF